MRALCLQPGSHTIGPHTGEVVYYALVVREAINHMSIAKTEQAFTGEVRAFETPCHSMLTGAGPKAVLAVHAGLRHMG